MAVCVVGSVTILLFEVVEAEESCKTRGGEKLIAYMLVLEDEWASWL